MLPGFGGTRTLAAQLDNQGTLTTTAALTLAKASAAHLNSGLINVSGGNLTVTQTGTSPSFTNTGAITLAANRFFTVTGGTLDLSAGLVSGGTGTLSTTGVALSFSTATVQTRVTFATTTIAGTVTIPSTDSLVVVGGAINSPVVNNGLLLTQGTVTLGGALTNTGLLRVRGSQDYGTSALTVTNGFTNAGAIEFTNIDGGYVANLTVTTGTLTNAPGGTITVLPGFGGARTITAGLIDNFGTMNVNASATASASIDQRGIMNVAASLTLTIPAGRALTLYPGSTSTVSGTLTNSGTCSNLGGAFSGFSCP